MLATENGYKFFLKIHFIISNQNVNPYLKGLTFYEICLQGLDFNATEATRRLLLLLFGTISRYEFML